MSGIYLVWVIALTSSTVTWGGIFVRVASFLSESVSSAARQGLDLGWVSQDSTASIPACEVLQVNFQESPGFLLHKIIFSINFVPLFINLMIIFIRNCYFFLYTISSSSSNYLYLPANLNFSDNNLLLQICSSTQSVLVGQICKSHLQMYYDISAHEHYQDVILENWDEFFQLMRKQWKPTVVYACIWNYFLLYLVFHFTASH